MANRLLEEPPRDEARIIRDAGRSGMFPQSRPSTRAVQVRRFEQQEVNARVRQMQERRRALQEAQTARMDTDRLVSEVMQSRIPALRTFNHQMADRRRLADQILAG